MALTSLKRSAQPCHCSTGSLPPEVTPAIRTHIANCLLGCPLRIAPATWTFRLQFSPASVAAAQPILNFPEDGVFGNFAVRRQNLTGPLSLLNTETYPANPLTP